jgi:diphthine synthase
MLILIGLGLWDEKDLTLRGIEEAKSSSKVYFEPYTSIWKGNIQNLEKLVEKKIFLLKRKDLEEDLDKFLEEAKNQKISILVGGDPLVATTHSSIILEAKKKNIETKIIHNASIVSAIAECGLHIYKFGRIVTIPLKEKVSSLPKSVYDAIKENKKRNLHTLCLLDVDFEKNKFLKVKEAIKILLQMEEEFKENIIDENSKAIVLSCLGSENRKIVFDKIKNILEKEFELPACLIIPSSLHFTEEEFLEKVF